MNVTDPAIAGTLGGAAAETDGGRARPRFDDFHLQRRKALTPPRGEGFEAGFFRRESRRQRLLTVGARSAGGLLGWGKYSLLETIGVVGE